LRSRRLHFYGLDFGAVRASSPNPARLLQTAISVDLSRQFVLGKNVSHHDINLHYAKDEICQRISSITHHAFVIPRKRTSIPPYSSSTVRTLPAAKITQIKAFTPAAWAKAAWKRGMVARPTPRTAAVCSRVAPNNAGSSTADSNESGQAGEPFAEEGVDFGVA
jgi:hypothetical protein